MTEKARMYGTVLYELNIPETMAGEAARLLRDNRQLMEVLTSPAVPRKKQYVMIEQVFREPEFSSLMVRFLKKACDAGCLGQIDDIAKVLKYCIMLAEGELEAQLSYVTMPDEAQIAGIKQFLCRKYHKKNIILKLVNEPTLMGGFLLKVRDTEYDYSLKGQLSQLRQAVAG